MTWSRIVEVGVVGPASLRSCPLDPTSEQSFLPNTGYNGRQVKEVLK